MRSRRRPSSPSKTTDGVFSQTIRLWILRILVPLGCTQKFVCKFGWEDDRLANFLGLNVPEIFDDEEKNDPIESINFLRNMHKEAEANSSASWQEGGLPVELMNNAHALSQRFNLGKVEQDILIFCVLIHSVSELRYAADYLGNLTSPRFFSALSTILGQDEEQIRAALSSSSHLMTSGLVCLTSQYSDELSSRLELLSDQFCRRMLSAVSDPMLLIRDTVSPSQEPTLTLDDYDHVETDIPLLSAYLKAALTARRKGVNVFVYGPPGTGKSELSRVLAKTLGCDLLEITSEDEDGDPIKGEQRLRSFRVAQSFFANHRCLLVFDEAEDVFQDGSLFSRSTAQSRKGWFNRMLENSAVPTIWLSNSKLGMDPAFMRRFDMSFCLDIPPDDKRRKILSELAGDILSEKDLQTIACSNNIAPAIVSRSVSVLKAISQDVPSEQHSSSLVHLINNTLESQGHDRLKTTPLASAEEAYDPAFINADIDLSNIAKSVKTASMKLKDNNFAGVRLCLYGPPGTGKTAYGHWLAKEIGRPLIIKRASDLLSMYLGETEKRIANAFSSAQKSNSVLMLDEVDSFLRDRRSAEQSWQVTQVNELLTQMESFQGIFVASTNLMDGLDQAALRRFDFKARFNYLTQEQAWAMFERLCHSLDIPLAGKQLREDLVQLKALTPGDFAVAARQQRFCLATSAEALLQSLQAEVGLKEQGQFLKRSIGFV